LLPASCWFVASLTLKVEVTRPSVTSYDIN
jgi:hypothetical protein